jgi:hypothetical protein
VADPHPRAPPLGSRGICLAAGVTYRRRRCKPPESRQLPEESTRMAVLMAAGQSAPRGLKLRGRRDECATLDRLLDKARAGRSGTLVLRGEAGVGKTALLERAVESASDLTVLRASGVESEMELPFAALHQLCAPLLDRLDHLSGATARFARDHVRAQRGSGAGPVLRRLGGARPPVRGGRGAPASVRDR